MKASKSARIGVVFLIGEESIQRLVDICNPYSTEMTFEVSLLDGSKIYPTSVEELSRLPNIEKRRILGIDIGNKYSDKVVIRISLYTNSSFDSISYSFTGEDRDVLLVDHHVNEWIETIRQKYSWLSFSGSSFWLFVIIWALGVLLVVGPVPLFLASQIFPRHPYAAPGSVVMIGLALQGVAYSSGWIRRRFFPSGMFDIGAGKERIRELNERRKRWSLVSAGIALAIGIIGALLLTLFSSQ